VLPALSQLAMVRGVFRAPAHQCQPEGDVPGQRLQPVFRSASPRRGETGVFRAGIGLPEATSHALEA
jgi:hypothetical protein